MSERSPVPSGPSVLDDLARLAARVADAPLAFVTLIDGTLQRFAASVGPRPEPVPIARSMCAHTVTEGAVIDVPDTLLDPRFASHPLVLGGPRIRAYHGVPLVVSGETLGTLCVLDHRPRTFDPEVRDLLDAVARQVVAQFELRRASVEADAASRAKSDFLATMSHEIRTPMNAILGMTEIALTSTSPEEVRECLRRVRRNGEALLGLISDILDLSKIEAGQLELDDRVIPLREVVEDALEGVAVNAARKDLRLLCLVDPAVPRHVRADRARLRQVLVNLLGNAVKFTHSGEVRLTARTRADGVEIAVTDTGIGMTPEESAAVFDKFWRSESVSGLGGTGLGMSITRSLVERMGGRIEVSSRVAEGTTFRVVLPFVEQPSSPLPPLPDPVPRVIVALRHPDVRACAERNLRTRGFDVTALPDARAASLALRGMDLVVAELADPGAEALVVESRRHGVAVLGVTPLGSATHDLSRRVDGVAHEPVGPARLLSRVEALTHVPVSEESVTGSVRLRTERVRARRVLVIEDHPDNRHITAHALRRAGYEVVVAVDGAEGVARARSAEFDLVLSDVAMPGMDGFEATQRIRAEERTQGWHRVPIVALTAHATSGFRERCLEAGMDDFATKPLLRAQLLELVARWIDPRPKVLVVDDSPDGRELVRRFLERDGRFSVRVADSGPTALETFARSGPELVLLDMEMPGMDGLQTARRLAELQPGHPVPILAVTGHTGLDWRRRCQEAGCDAMLEKPLRRDALVRSVAAMLGLPAVETACRAS